MSELRCSRNLKANVTWSFHARPTAIFVKAANCFQSEIIVENRDGEKVNGKSIMGMMLLAIGPGSIFTIHAVGEDAHEAVEALCKLVTSDYDTFDYCAFRAELEKVRGKRSKTTTNPS